MAKDNYDAEITQNLFFLSQNLIGCIDLKLLDTILSKIEIGQHMFIVQ